MGATNMNPEKHAEGNSRGPEFHDPMAITWMEKYSNTLDKIWARLPDYVGSIIVTLVVFTLGATMTGMCSTQFTDKLCRNSKFKFEFKNWLKGR
jgi:hypothetical protein